MNKNVEYCMRKNIALNVIFFKFIYKIFENHHHKKYSTNFNFRVYNHYIYTHLKICIIIKKNMKIKRHLNRLIIQFARRPSKFATKKRTFPFSKGAWQPRNCTPPINNSSPHILYSTNRHLEAHSRHIHARLMDSLGTG